MPMQLTWFHRVCLSKTSFNNMFKTFVCTALVVSFLSACGGGSGGMSAPAGAAGNATPGSNNGLTPAAGTALAANALPVTVDKGPAGNNVNRLYTEVTICQAGSTTLCQTIDHVLVDTGSTGLRLLSEVVSPSLNLSRVTAPSTLPLLACAQFLDNTFAWGPVVNADVTLGGKTATGISVQVVGDPAFNRLARTCSPGTAVDNLAALGAKGIIGLGMFKEDCGPACASVTNNGIYFTCATPSCTTAAPTRASIARQLKNPVPLFASDNNGFLIDLPAVASVGTVSLNGSLIFGIGTQPNNQVTSSKVLTTDTNGYFLTLLSGRSLDTSFIDTGSNGLFFDSPEIPVCSAGSSSSFYCPASFLTFSATQTGTNAVSNSVVFSVENAATYFASPEKSVLPNLAGTIGNARTFDWGLPFFYGRRVYKGIEGQPSVIGVGPFYAF